MRKTLKIAILELSILFYSPVAWLVLTIFMVQNGMSFLNMFGGYQEVIAMGNHVDNLTFSIFPGLNGLFDNVQQNLYLYIPLLTMGLMSREISSGSIKLLLSSPVKIREIILGKYLAMVGYGLLIILVLVIYAAVGVIVIKDADIRLIISGLTGIFLLICTYAAIGLFMSSLTSYQVVAAISTLAVFGALQFVGKIGQDINFVRDLTYFLSISGRADDMLKGLITSKDVIYFMIIIGLFLYLTILRLQMSRETKNLTVQVGRYALLISIVLLLGYTSSRPAFTAYLDMTAGETRTLTKNSREVAGKIAGELKITTYVNLLDQNVYLGLPVSRNSDLARFDQYRRYIPGLKMDYVYYYDMTDLKNNSNMVYQGDLKGLNTRQIAEKVADNMGVDLDAFMPPAEIRRQINLAPENNNLVRVLEYKGRRSWLRFYNEIDQFAGEAEITAAIKRLTVTVPKVAFVTGDNERSTLKKGDRDYELITTMNKSRNALVNQGFDILSTDLNRDTVPAGLQLLVLADPTAALSGVAIQRLRAYISKGGNMLIAGEPGRQDFLNPVLQQLGIQMKAGTLVNPTKDFTPEQIFGVAPGQAVAVAMPGAAGLDYQKTGEFEADTLLLSPPQGWNKTGQIDLTSTEVEFNAAEGDKKGVFPLALALTRQLNGREQRIFVAGDADFMSNAEITKGKGNNRIFIRSIFNWFSDGLFPVDVSRTRTTDDAIMLSRKQISSLKLVILGLMPALLIALGAFVLISRKRN